ncbi:MAG TPA: hypothetical protein PL110_00870 [Candidatus Eremiobacteraeota bacterium]|nr:MAG: hypothetical protein BWY64_02792 [bacterium ADurb.Bin363]HPZ06638.1 hypothetical protein [Candidatus Eremiobacteraeota bacterium]
MAQRRRPEEDGISAINALTARRKKPGATIGTRVDTIHGNKMTEVSRKGQAQGLHGQEKSVWLKDRVTLSVEAQLLLLEMRRTNPIDLDSMEYTNRIDNLEVKSNIFVQILPFGAYRLNFRG